MAGSVDVVEGILKEAMYSTDVSSPESEKVVSSSTVSIPSSTMTSEESRNSQEYDIKDEVVQEHEDTSVEEEGSVIEDNLVLSDEAQSQIYNLNDSEPTLRPSSDEFTTTLDVSATLNEQISTTVLSLDGTTSVSQSPIFPTSTSSESIRVQTPEETFISTATISSGDASRPSSSSASLRIKRPKWRKKPVFKLPKKAIPLRSKIYGLSLIFTEPSVEMKFVVAQSVQGMNNQLMTYMEAIMAAYMTNRVLVKPVFCARPYTGLECYPLEAYFNLTDFQNCVPSVTPEEFARSKAGWNTSVIHFSRHGPHPYKKFIDAKDWYHIPAKALRSKKSFNLFDTKMKHGLLPILDHDALGPQHRTLLFDCLLQDVEVHYPSLISCFQPRSEILSVVDEFVQFHFFDAPFIAAHFRSGDFKTYCQKAWIQNLGNYACELTVEDFIEQVKALQVRHGIDLVFIATDDQGTHRQAFLQQGWILFGDTPFSIDRLKLQAEPHHVGDTLMLIDQMICVKASAFLGNRFSTTSLNIIRRRQGLNSTYLTGS
jgi:hypothetical protein